MALDESRPALLRQIPLEILDFWIDPVNQRLVGDPEHAGSGWRRRTDAELTLPYGGAARASVRRVNSAVSSASSSAIFPMITD